MQRFPAVLEGMSRDEVEARLGPPTRTSTREREVIDGSKRWHLWIDPEDEGRWVAVLYGGRYEGIVIGTKSRGVTLA